MGSDVGRKGVALVATSTATGFLVATGFAATTIRAATTVATFVFIEFGTIEFVTIGLNAIGKR